MKSYSRAIIFLPQAFVILGTIANPSISKASIIDGAIVAFFTNPPENTIVHINKGKKSGIHEGEKLTAYRTVQKPYRIEVPTGIVKIIKSTEHYSFGEVIQSSHQVTQQLNHDYGIIMAGDSLARKKTNLTRKMQFVPDISMSYFDLFKDPKASPSSFELSESGLARLEKVAQKLGAYRVSKLLIKGFTDYRGHTDENQIESYQRALTIKQIFVDTFGFDPNRVIAIGLGETEDRDSSYIEGFQRNNRRIEFKVITKNS